MTRARILGFVLSILIFPVARLLAFGLVVCFRSGKGTLEKSKLPGLSR